MSEVDRCNVGRRTLSTLLGTGAAATFGGAVSAHGDAGSSGEPIPIGDVAARDPLSTRLTREYRCALSVRQRGNGVRLVPAAGDGGFQPGSVSAFSVMRSSLRPATQQLVRMMDHAPSRHDRLDDPLPEPGPVAVHHSGQRGDDRQAGGDVAVEPVERGRQAASTGGRSRRSVLGDRTGSGWTVAARARDVA